MKEETKKEIEERKPKDIKYEIFLPNKHTHTHNDKSSEAERDWVALGGFQKHTHIQTGTVNL